MTSKEMVSTIQKHEVFKDLAPKELVSMEKIVDKVQFKEGETVFKINTRPEYIYYVIDGSFTLYFPNNTHLELNKGDLIGEIGILNGDFRLGTLVSNEKTEVITICGTHLFNEKFVHPSTSLKIVRLLSRRITNYLKSTIQTSSQEIIKEGESNDVEFKSTIRWNIHSKKRDKDIEHASLKTLAAFMNSQGGHLFIGVNDKGEILGLKQDGFQNNDKLLLHMTNLIKDRIGSIFLTHLTMHIEEINGLSILRIDCLPATEPAYVNDTKDDYFYIRTGPSTTKLRTSEIHDYIKNRFEFVKVV